MNLFLKIAALSAVCCQVCWGEQPSLRAEERVLDPFEYVEELARRTADLNPNDKAAPELIPTEQAIAMFESRVKQTQGDYSNRTVLGQLYLRDAKESDHLASYAKAEQVLREALENSPNYSPAQIYLATALQAQHQFREALQLAELFLIAKPNHALGLAVLGDSQIELGMYDEVRLTYNQLQTISQAPSIQARIAHLMELDGDVQGAIKLMSEATTATERSGTLVTTQAWFNMRLAHLYFNHGQLAAAEQHYDRSLILVPEYAAAQSGLILVKQAQGKTDEALSMARAAVETHGEPPMMATLGDLLMLAGEQAESQQWYDQAQASMEEEAKVAASAHYREFAMFLLDHQRQPELALELARKDFAMRPSIASHDVLAWALHKNGQDEEALQHIQQALRLGTHEAMYFAHAGHIYDSLGQNKQASLSYAKALEINPAFSILGAPEVRARLKELQ